MYRLTLNAIWACAEGCNWLALDVRVRATLLAALVRARADRPLAGVPVRHDANSEALARQPRDRYPPHAMAAYALAQLAVHERLHAHDPPVLRLVDLEGEAPPVPAPDRARRAGRPATACRGLARVADRQDQLRRMLGVVPHTEHAAEAVGELRQRRREVRRVA